MLGLLGPYVLLGTIGVSGVLPQNLSLQTETETEVSINNNFYNYSNTLSTEDRQNTVLILDCNFYDYGVGIHYFPKISMVYDSRNLSSDYPDEYYYNCSSILSQKTISNSFNNYICIYTFSECLNNSNINSTLFFANPYQFDTQDYIEWPRGSNFVINNIYYARTNSGGISGSAITDGIKGGLGIMKDITKQFGSGFGALIWDNSKNQLTTFGNFALIFLGVSITFSIVKLCMSLIRSKTGS